MKPIPLLTADEMHAADQAAIKAGTLESTLMQRAAEALVSVIVKHFEPCRVVVMCGFGNNGGDGRIAAMLLERAGFAVKIVTPQEDFAADMCSAELIVDALLGTGLNKELTDRFVEAIASMNAALCPVVSCDISSGINATTGEVMGCAVKADHTVTFAAAKRGHFLLPGKAHTGMLHIMDIGIDVPEAKSYLNTPALWKIPAPALGGHKYMRGHALVMGGLLASTGAAKLTANAALKIGAGAVSIICDQQTLPIYAASMAAVMTKPVSSADDFYALVNEPRVTALAIGPGAGVGERTSKHVVSMLETRKNCVLDADALQKEILPALHDHCTITPHAGEFERIFGVHEHKIEAAKYAVDQFSGVLVYKGSDTIIAQAGKPIIINANAPPTLATAGSGDVLTGIITGLLAQGMKPFEAACAGVWLHGEAARHMGRFFAAEDIVSALGDIRL
jgi:hydroxyethylthiazole kinase-like uncharacterized protein yjeF